MTDAAVGAKVVLPLLAAGLVLVAAFLGLVVYDQ